MHSMTPTKGPRGGGGRGGGVAESIQIPIQMVSLLLLAMTGLKK